MSQQLNELAEIDFFDEEIVSLYLESIDKYFDLPVEIFESADLDIGKKVNISLKVLNSSIKREIVDTIGGFIKNPRKQEPQ